jgi:hypothetical protein
VFNFKNEINLKNKAEQTLAEIGNHEAIVYSSDNNELTPSVAEANV